jgi:biopolymer transport protein ExbD
MLNLIKNFGLYIVLLLIILFMIVAGAIKKREYDKRVLSLQNEAASMAKTVEDQKGLYEKLSLQNSNVKDMLDTSNTQTKELSDQLSKAKQQLQSAVEISAQWKSAYQASVKGAQTTEPPAVAGQSERTKVTFNKDFGPFIVDGYTLTNPAEAFLTVSQGIPLKLTIAMSQDSNKAWHAYSTSSDPNTKIDIELASVNPWLNETKWYEKIGVLGDVGFGSTSSGAGVLVGTGLSYEINNVELGPKVWADITSHVDIYYGIGLVWHPFQQR